MTRRVYASRRKTRRSRSRRSGPSLRAGALTLLVLCGFVSGLVYLSRHRSAPPQKPTGSQPSPETAPQTHAPHFEFYTILPKSQMDVSPPSDQPAQAHYVLQVASVQDAAEADRLKAELALLGFASAVHPFEKAGHHWFRVTVGPYDHRDAAQADQARLKENHVESLVRQVPGTP